MCGLERALEHSAGQGREKSKVKQETVYDGDHRNPMIDDRILSFWSSFVFSSDYIKKKKNYHNNLKYLCYF